MSHAEQPNQGVGCAGEALDAFRTRSAHRTYMCATVQSVEVLTSRRLSSGTFLCAMCILPVRNSVCFPSV